MTTEARTAYVFDRVPAKARELLPVIGPTAYAVLGCLSAFADRDGKCWPSIETLVRMSGMSRATIRRSLKILERFGVLSQQRRTKAGHEKLNDTNVYLIAYQPCESPGWVVSPVTLGRVTSDARGRVMGEPGVGSPVTPELDPLNQTQVNQTQRTISDAAIAAGDETTKPPVSSKKKKAEASPEDTETRPMVLGTIA
jgi:DNA-binding transcriptional MocR family regulator